MADSISGARGGGGGGVPVSGAAGGCYAAFAAGNLLITPHNTRALRGAALAGQRLVNDTAHARVQRAELRTAARSLARVGVRIIGLHATSVHKLLKLLLYVRGRLPHWAAGGGDDGAASCPAGGVLFLCEAAEARSGRKARCRAGG